MSEDLKKELKEYMIEYWKRELIRLEKRIEELKRRIKEYEM